MTNSYFTTNLTVITNIMVKYTAATMVIATNWVSVGTFRDKAGTSYDVLQGSITTNYVGKMEAEGQTVEFPFKSIPGPKLEQFKLVPIATQGLSAYPVPPMFINPKFAFPPNSSIGTNSH